LELGQKQNKWLLVAQAVHFAAIGALPSNPVTGHTPEVFQQTVLTDGEPTAAGPAERHFFPAATAAFLPHQTEFFTIGTFIGRVGHVQSLCIGS
jgi:hypothetical protein